MKKCKNQSEDFLSDFEQFKTKAQSKLSDKSLVSNNFSISPMLSLNLLKKLREHSPESLHEFLQEIYQAFTTMERVKLDPTQEEFYTREKILDEYRQFMVEIVKDANLSDQTCKLVLKLIIAIGNIRNSGEDYLTVYNLIQEHGLSADLTQEIPLNRLLSENQTISDSKEEKKFSLRNDSASEMIVYLEKTHHFN